jgi:hypothetical protein
MPRSNQPNDIASGATARALDPAVSQRNLLQRHNSRRRAIVFIVLFCAAVWAALLILAAKFLG